jgi:WD40 repeat protein
MQFARLFLAALVLQAIRQAPARAQAVDQYGDALPAGTVARLGTLRYRHPGWHKRVAFLPDNETFLTGSEDNSLRLWNAHTGERVFEFDFEGYTPLAWQLSRDGRTVAAVSRLINFETRERRVRINLFRAPLWRERGRIELPDQDVEELPSKLAISPDDRYVALGSERGGLLLYNVETGDRVARHELSRPVGHIEGIAFSPVGDLLAVVGYGGAVVWPFLEAEEPQSLPGPLERVRSVVFSHEGDQLAVGLDGAEAGRVFDVVTRREICRLHGQQPSYYPENLCYSSDGREILAPGHRADTVEFFDATTGQLLRTWDAPGTEPCDLAYSPDGQLLVAVGGKCVMTVWDVATGNRLSDRFDGGSEHAYVLEYAPDGRSVVSGDMDGGLRFWDPATGRLQRKISAHDHWVAGLACSPDGRWIVTCGLDDKVKLWDAATGREVYALPGHGTTGGSSTTAVGFAPDSQTFYSFGGDLFLRAYSVESGRILTEHAIRPAGVNIPEGEDGKVEALDPFARGGGGFGLESAVLATNSSSLVLNHARVFDVATGRESEALRTTRPVEQVIVAPDAKLLATFESAPLPAAALGGRTGRQPSILCLRGFDDQQLVTELELPGQFGHRAAFSPDGRQLAFTLYKLEDYGSRDRKHWITIVDVSSLREIARIENQTESAFHLAFSPDGRRLAASQTDSSILVWDLDALAVDPAP